jgi:hypothetical protein
VQPADWQTPLEALMAGRYWVEERLMVRMHVERFDPFLGAFTTLCSYDTLNDVVLSRGNLARVVRISAELDEGHLTTTHLRRAGCRHCDRQHRLCPGCRRAGDAAGTAQHFVDADRRHLEQWMVVGSF